MTEMTNDLRQKDRQWNLPRPSEHMSVDGAQLAVLMDIRDELKALNALLSSVPYLLTKIASDKKRPKRNVR